VIWSVVINHDTRPMISVAIPVDDDCFVPVGIAVPISVYNDRLIAVAVPFSIRMNRHAVRSHASANIVSQNRR
jgi:hypothetical protein